MSWLHLILKTNILLIIAHICIFTSLYWIPAPVHAGTVSSTHDPGQKLATDDCILHLQSFVVVLAMVK